MGTQLRPLAAGEWRGAGPRPGRPLQIRSFTLSGFAVQAGKVVAVGTLSAVLETAAGPGVDTSIVTTIALPVSIRQMSDEVLRVEQGSLYPALYRLEERGWVRAEWGVSENNRRARFYELTTAGVWPLAAPFETPVATVVIQPGLLAP